MTVSSPLAVALVSGGLDSMVAAARMRADGYRLLALSIDYNQRHQIELAAARRIASTLGAERHVVLPLNLRAFGGSALTDEIDVPKEGVGDDIPVTFAEQVQKAVDCYNAGATVLHVHVREPDGQGSKNLDRFNEMLDRLRTAVPGMRGSWSR